MDSDPLGDSMTPRPLWSSALRHRWESKGCNEWLSVLDGFENNFGRALLWALDVPGRICVLGEHSDYVPYIKASVITFASAEQRMRALVAPREDGVVRIGSSLSGCDVTEFTLGEEVFEGEWLDALDERGVPEQHWSNYVRGAVAHTLKLHELKFGFDMFLDSTIAPASGTSSSSALTTCGMVAIHLANGLSWNRESITKEGGEAEWYVGTRGGMMDHATMAYAEEGKMLGLQFRPFVATSLRGEALGCKWYSVFTHPADKGGTMMDAFNELALVQQTIIPQNIDNLVFENPGDHLGWEIVMELIDEVIESARFGRIRVKDRFRYVMREYNRVVDFRNALEDSNVGVMSNMLEESWIDTRDLLGTHTQEMEDEAIRLRAIPGVLGVKVLGAGFGGNLLVLADDCAELGEGAVEQTPGKGLEALELESESTLDVKCAAILLCGGKGSRMASQGIEVHKPLIPIDGVPSLLRVLDQLEECAVEFDCTLVVVPPDKVGEYEIVLLDRECKVLVQHNPMGTGDAVNCALSHLPDDIEHVYVSFGTQPLVQNGTIHASLEHQIENGLGFTLPTTITTNPYAPLIRDADKRVVDSVETHLEGAEKLEVGEANVGAYWATIGTLNSVLTQIVASKWSGKKYNTPSGELGYPNEMVRACLNAGVSVDGIPCADPSEMIGIKRIEDVTIVENYYEMRKRWAANG